MAHRRALGLVRASFGESGTNGNVGLRQAFEDPFDVAGVVLAVSVHLDRPVVVQALGVFEPRAHRSPNAHVVGQLQNARARGARNARGVVRRTVVDDQQVVGGHGGLKLTDRRPDDFFLIPCGHDDEAAQRGVSVWNFSHSGP